jgi:hypothetical protein
MQFSQFNAQNDSTNWCEASWLFAEYLFNARQLFSKEKERSMQTLYIVFRARSSVSGNSIVFVLLSNDR